MNWFNRRPKAKLSRVRARSLEQQNEDAIVKLNELPRQTVAQLAGARDEMRDFARDGVADGPENRRRRSALMSSLPWRIVAKPFLVSGPGK
jgi:hypothetical protein